MYKFQIDECEQPGILRLTVMQEFEGGFQVTDIIEGGFIFICKTLLKYYSPDHSIRKVK